VIKISIPSMNLMKLAVAVKAAASVFLFLAIGSVVASAAVSHASFGSLPDGSPVTIYRLTGGHLEVRVMTFGARVVSIKTPDRNGEMANIVLGYDKLADYVNDRKTYFGAVPGRYANRIANGAFRLEGKEYHLSANESGNTLHGGKDGFDRRNWTSKEIPDGVEFTLVSADGDQGFPGRLTAKVRYTIQGSTVFIRYSATTDKPTVVNLTNHAYFNLSGAGSGTILHDKLTIFGDKMTPVNSKLIPTGEIKPVIGTPFDFTHPEVIGARIDADDQQIKLARGYDHNWILGGAKGKLHQTAEVYDPSSGRVLKEGTTEPGVQFYSGNFLDGTFHGPRGKVEFRNGLCLETQHFPDSPNESSFPSTELKPGQSYSSETTWTFTVR
jgi:aldose 1-epimerase